MKYKVLFFLLIGSAHSAFAENWPQGPGTNFDFTASAENLPTTWSVSLDQNIAWRATLPETGQSAPVIWEERIFLTTMKPVKEDSAVGKDIVAWCLSTKDGSVLWQQEIQGQYNTRLSAPFGDASAPAAVTDGKRVWFLNPTGRIVCFDFEGNELWSKKVTSVSRTQPVLFNGNLIFHKQHYLPDEDGGFPHKRSESGKHTWTQLSAIDASTGSQVWTSECGVNMGCVPLIQKLSNGTNVLVVGRGGGHGPPETPPGISMIRADNGSTMWTLELDNFMSTQTYPVVNDQVLVFHKSYHLWVDGITGKISRQVSITKDVPVVRRVGSQHQTVTETLVGNKSRSITQQSNLRVGNHHYFRAYTKNYLGRVHIQIGKVEYLQLPLAVMREPELKDRILWNLEEVPPIDGKQASKKKKNAVNITSASFQLNHVRNSRGILVMGDKRAVQTGWGHTASPIATAFGNRLYVPILSGIVFVIQADAEVLDDKAILGINDLGRAGEAFTRASLTTSGNRIYAHTIKELISIGDR